LRLPLKGCRRRCRWPAAAAISRQSKPCYFAMAERIALYPDALIAARGSPLPTGLGPLGAGAAAAEALRVRGQRVATSNMLNRDRQWARHHSSPADRRIGRTAHASSDLPFAHLCPRWGADRLRSRYDRPLPARRSLRRPNTEG